MSQVTIFSGKRQSGQTTKAIHAALKAALDRAMEQLEGGELVAPIVPVNVLIVPTHQSTASSVYRIATKQLESAVKFPEEGRDLYRLRNEAHPNGVTPSDFVKFAVRYLPWPPTVADLDTPTKRGTFDVLMVDQPPHQTLLCLFDANSEAPISQHIHEKDIPVFVATSADPVVPPST